MTDLLTEITQISIHLKEQAEKVSEVALFQPLARTSTFNVASKPIAGRKWSYKSNLSFFRRISLNFQSFLFKYLPKLIPSERLTSEAKFKTVLAMLLAQEEVRDSFLNDAKRREDFFQALKEAAQGTGYLFEPPTVLTTDTPLSISRQLTRIKDVSLLDDVVELNLQIAALNFQERSEIMFRILNRVERPPITSVVEIKGAKESQAISITTQYAKYKITHYDEKSGQVSYSVTENHATSSIRTKRNSLPNALGTKNQRIAYDAETKKPISSYCGELSTPFHALEQILYVLGQKNGSCLLEKKSGIKVTKKTILFTSLYSWHELDLITDQKAAISKWDQKILTCGNTACSLNLLYVNIPFGALNKYPTPAETKANMQDINDEAFIFLVTDAWAHLGFESDALTAIVSRCVSIKELSDSLFLEKEKALIQEVDAFRKLKPSLLKELDLLHPSDFVLALKGLLNSKKKGIDKLLYLDCLATHLGYFHNKNCHNATDRSAGADAADKAQFAYTKLYGKAFLPGYETEEERALFEVLYSMYLVWEEPEINTWLSTGFVGEKFHNNLFQKNPEITRYLVKWLKKHPEIYRGLSDYRT